MIKVGELRERFRFERRAVDAAGRPFGAWGDAVTLAAKMIALKGSARSSEEVMSQRLQGRQPIILTVRGCKASRAIDSTWRAVDTRTGDIYGVKSAALNSESRAFRDILAQADGTNG